MPCQLFKRRANAPYTTIHAWSPSQPLILIFGNIHVCIRCSSDRFIRGSTLLLDFGCRRLDITTVTSSISICSLGTAESIVGHPLHLQLADTWDLVCGIDELEWSASSCTSGLVTYCFSLIPLIEVYDHGIGVLWMLLGADNVGHVLQC
jgi:hypothetical protein